MDSITTRNRIKYLLKEKQVMIEYLHTKLANEDWHGVQDAGSDLREIEVELKTLRRFLDDLSEVRD